jgi:hypothetical protein
MPPTSVLDQGRPRHLSAPRQPRPRHAYAVSGEDVSTLEKAGITLVRLGAKFTEYVEARKQADQARRLPVTVSPARAERRRSRLEAATKGRDFAGTRRSL